LSSFFLVFRFLEAVPEEELDEELDEELEEDTLDDIANKYSDVY
jgi:hypothetical protein